MKKYRKGKNNPSYKHGKYCQAFINKCIDCQIILVNPFAKRCSICATQFLWAKTSIFQNRKKRIKKPTLAYCCDCGKKLSRTSFYKKYKRCKSCARKEQYKNSPETNWMYGRTKNKSPNFGKLAGHGKGKKYKGIYMRSSWEILFAKFLDFHKIKWLYESKTFTMIDCTYTPDFYLPDIDEHIEIKGWWWDKTKFKYNLFKIFYPLINIKTLMKQDLQQLGVL